MKNIIEDIKLRLLQRKLKKSEKFFTFSCALKKGYIDAGSNIVYSALEDPNDINEVLRREREYINLLKKDKAELVSVTGTKFGDLVSSGVNNILSKKFVDFIKGKGFKKLDFYPVTIRKYRTGEKLSPYFYIEPQFYCKRVSPKSGNSILVCGTLLYAPATVFFDISTWNNNDIFGIEGTRFIIVTKRFKEIIEKNKFTNVEFGDVYETN